jgi:hypothetical protein
MTTVPTEEKTRRPRGRLRVLLALPLVAGALLLTSSIGLAGTISITGNVNNDGSTTVYNTQHCMSYWWGPEAQAFSWPGSTLYLAVNYQGNTLNFTSFPQNNYSWRWISNLAYGSCYHIAAHKDGNWWNWGTSPWAANLYT